MFLSSSSVSELLLTSRFTAVSELTLINEPVSPDTEHAPVPVTVTAPEPAPVPVMEPILDHVPVPFPVTEPVPDPDLVPVPVTETTSVPVPTMEPMAVTEPFATHAGAQHSSSFCASPSGDTCSCANTHSFAVPHAWFHTNATAHAPGLRLCSHPLLLPC